MDNSKNNKIQTIINTLFDHGKNKPNGDVYQNIVDSLTVIKQKSLNKNELNDYYYYLASAYFKLKKFNNAYKTWQKAVVDFPKSSRVNYGFGQSLIYAGNLDEAITFFNKVKAADLIGDYSLQMAHYMYLWNRPKEGYEYLKPIFNAYLNLGIIDDTFLHIRHLPFFDRTWNTYVALLWIDNRIQEASTELANYKHLHDYDFAFLESLIGAVTGKADWSQTLNIIGNDTLRKIVFSARSSKSFDQAKEMLMNAPASPNMKNDIIKYIALAEISSKFNLQDEEKKYIKRVKEINDLLLEPYNAVVYNFLAYQEKLKKIYRDNVIAQKQSGADDQLAKNLSQA